MISSPKMYLDKHLSDPTSMKNLRLSTVSIRRSSTLANYVLALFYIQINYSCHQSLSHVCGFRAGPGAIWQAFKYYNRLWTKRGASARLDSIANKAHKQDLEGFMDNLQEEDI